ncbi:hypothetical protein DXG03_009588 [Asterophora parasitica]|uniref:Vps72/YL1 N-terminal domain-containing protein n=1 Tax=Asterophora parasitica TaxID=117018 RepID=A0A9P7GB52_9AGAR|nr:hypothetical protein DXG03_009588 [Asterophora parasitica]
MALDTTIESIEDDKDFVNDKDEEDVFGSDFESTDEEAAQEDAEAGDKAVQEEERRARKEARSRVERATAAAHAKHKVAFNPQVQSEASTSKAQEKPKVKRRVSLGLAVNAETGDVLSGEKGSPKKKRTSQRKHTILNTSATVKRLKRSEEKKAATPKKVMRESKRYTQAELIALALDNEEGNIVEHRDYLKVEEEKRRRARVVRATVEGPLIRWISRGEEIKVIVPPPPQPTFAPRPPYAFASLNSSGTTMYGQGTPFTYSAGVYPHMASGSWSAHYTPAVSSSASTSTAALGATPGPSTRQMQTQPESTAPTPTSTPTPTSQPTAHPISTPTPTQPQITSYQPTYNPYMMQLQSQSTSSPYPTAYSAFSASAPPQPQPTERLETVAKNYVVHELAQERGVPKPPWENTMSAMFGDHVKWDEVKVFIGKGRPFTPEAEVCDHGETGEVLGSEDGRAVCRFEGVWGPYAASKS